MVVLSLVLTLSLLAGCGASPSSDADTSSDTANSDTIRVGLNYELSGAVATYGQNLTEGVELALEEINKMVEY